MTSDVMAARPAPIGSSERIDSIDVLRGFAVLGILALNIQSFAMPGSAYMNPTSFGDFDGINYWLWYLVHLLGDMKFWSIFSMLFGAGIVIMTERAEATGRRAVGVHYRRMLWLLLFGLLHAHLIWYGDILFTYALCGMLLYRCRRWTPRTLYVVGLILLLIGFAISWGFGVLLASPHSDEMQTQMRDAWTPRPEVVQDELETFRGDWLTQMPKRSQGAMIFETFLFLTNFGWRSGGLILIGMGLFKQGVFSARRSRRFYWGLVMVGALVGLPIVAYGVQQNETHNWALKYSFFFGSLYNYWGSVLVALGWVGAVMIVCQSDRLVPWTRPLAAAGRMALTCYMLESIVATFIFYGHGLGWFGYLERWEQYLVVVGIWIALLLFATFWLRRFRFGPFEWLWRSLTYWRWQPIHRAETEATSG